VLEEEHGGLSTMGSHHLKAAAEPTLSESTMQIAASKVKLQQQQKAHLVMWSYQVH
jgi:hypothetical protein